jgi:hypothetical protein
MDTKGRPAECELRCVIIFRIKAKKNQRLYESVQLEQEASNKHGYGLRFFGTIKAFSSFPAVYYVSLVFPQRKPC